ncbi:MAG: hypothetical protein ABH860_02670, partial [bacterium]
MMNKKFIKWRRAGFLLLVLFLWPAVHALADVAIDSSDYNYFEQNSYRPLRVKYSTGASACKILGFDAHLQYNNDEENFGIPT